MSNFWVKSKAKRHLFAYLDSGHTDRHAAKALVTLIHLAGPQLSGGWLMIPVSYGPVKEVAVRKDATRADYLEALDAWENRDN